MSRFSVGRSIGGELDWFLGAVVLSPSFYVLEYGVGNGVTRGAAIGEGSALKCQQRKNMIWK
jgi:hypothetical protein